MALSLYDATVANYLQILGAVDGVLKKSLKHFREKEIDPAGVVAARLASDMLPLWFQIVAVVHHSQGAIEATKTGSFGPPPRRSDFSYEELQAMVGEAQAEMSALSRESVNSLAGREVIFKRGELELPFTSEEFLMSFSLPNFFFHATTAYDIFRHKGVPLEKRDFIGKMRFKAQI